MHKTYLLLRDNCRCRGINLLSLSSIKLCFLFFLCHAAAESNTEDLISLSSPPEIINLDIHDLERLAIQEREVKTQWNDYQQKMIDSFRSALEFQSQYPESEFAAKEVWRRYLETFNAENPYSTLDDQLRELAASSPSDDSFLALLNESHSSLSTDKAERAMPSVATNSTEISKSDDSLNVTSIGTPEETTPEVSVGKQELAEEEVSSSTLSNQKNTITDNKIYDLVSESCIREQVACRLRFEEEQTHRIDFDEAINQLATNAEFDKKLLFQAGRLHSLSSEAQELGRETVYSGPLNSTYPDGSEQFIGISTKGLLDGDVQYFFPTGQIALEGSFRLGKAKGKFKEWHKNGQLARLYTRGKRGKHEEFFSTGDKKVLAKLDNTGRYHGKFVEWYSNGVKRYEGYFNHGVVTRKHREWYPSGAIALVYTHSNPYQNDCVDSNLIANPTHSFGGKKRLFENHDNPSPERSCFSGELSPFDMSKKGYQLYPDGRKRWEAKKTSLARYSPSGQVELELKGRNEKAYHENGNLASERSWNGRVEADGKWSLWYSNGNLRQETDFEDGVRNGQVNIYYDNGVVAESGRYKDDQRDGVWITNTPNGTLKATVCYESGKSISCERTDS